MNLSQAKWFKRLGESEQQDVAGVVQVLYDWTQGKFARPNQDWCYSQKRADQDVQDLMEYGLKEKWFFALYAIGSAITDKSNPTDTDLLLVTNLFPNDVYSVQPKFQDLVAKLEETHNVTLDQEVESRYSDAETEARLKLDLQIKEGSAKPIDIVYQWDILSPQHWEANDKFDSQKIFCLGAKNPQGYDCGLDGNLDEIPLEIFRLSEAKSYMLDRRFSRARELMESRD